MPAAKRKPKDKNERRRHWNGAKNDGSSCMPENPLGLHGDEECCPGKRRGRAARLKESESRRETEKEPTARDDIGNRSGSKSGLIEQTKDARTFFSAMLVIQPALDR